MKKGKKLEELKSDLFYFNPNKIFGAESASNHTDWCAVPTVVHNPWTGMCSPDTNYPIDRSVSV